MTDVLACFVSAEASFTLARIFLVAGLGVGLLSWWDTVGHIGDPDLLMPHFTLAPSHGWYHFFREAGSDVAKMSVFLLIFFGPTAWRNPVTGWISLILMLGYYAPFWIGKPFLPALAAPNRSAAIIHALMAAFSFSALVLAWPTLNSVNVPR